MDSFWAKLTKNIGSFAYLCKKYRSTHMTIFHAIRHTADEHWQAFKAIYQQSFPIDEQRPIDDIVRLMSDEKRYSITALVDDSNQCIGILTVWNFSTYIYIRSNQNKIYW